MIFIKLTTLNNIGNNLNYTLINMDLVTHIERVYGQEYSKIYSGAAISINVKETPEEILRIIEGSK